MRELDLDTLKLEAGAHRSDGNEFCIMEAVAFIAGESWTDGPRCACPVITAFIRACNDTLGMTNRQKLKQFILPLVNSKSSLDVEISRAKYLANWCQQFKNLDTEYVHFYAARVAAADALNCINAIESESDDGRVSPESCYAAEHVADAFDYAFRAAVDAEDVEKENAVCDQAIKAIKDCLNIVS